jgi:hypothetical protein
MILKTVGTCLYLLVSVLAGFAAAQHNQPCNPPTTQSSHAVTMTFPVETQSRSLIVYVERIHDISGGDHLWNVKAFVTQLLRRADHPKVTVVLWPNETYERVESIDGSLLRSNEDKFADRIESRIGAPDEEGFDVGLRACDRLADQGKADIIIMSDGIMWVPWTAQRKALLKSVAAKHNVSIITTERGPENAAHLPELKPLISGSLVAIWSGDQNVAR